MINHTITVRNRRIKVDTPRLIQGCDGSDAIILDLDDEWTGLDEILVSIGSGSGLHGAEPERLLRLPAELLSVLRLLSHGKKV